jgi:PmbA protein
MLDTMLKDARLALQIALKSGAKDAVAAISDGQSTVFEYRDGKLEKVQQSASRSLGVSLYVDGKFSSHSTTDLRPEQMRRFIEDAVALTRYLEPDPFRVIPDPNLYKDRAKIDLDLVDSAVGDLNREQCLEWLKAMDGATHADKRVISSTSSVSYSRGASARVTSNGFEGTQEGTHAGYGSSVTLDEGNGRRPEAHRYCGGRFLKGLIEPEQVAGEALSRALERLGAGKGASVRTTMVVDPEAGPGLLRHLLGALSAGSIQQKRSFLANKKDQKIASEKLSLRDEPLIPRGLASRLYDGEGISARSLPIFERGELKNYYIDTYYGRKLGWAPTTGGGSNLKFELGNKNLAELIAGAGEGIYVNSWLGGNCDSTTGDFSLGIRGHKIENGRKGAPIGEMNITGNYLTMLAKLSALGNDPYPYSSWHTPTLLFEDVEFSGK